MNKQSQRTQPTPNTKTAAPATPPAGTDRIVMLALGAVAFLLYANTLGHAYVLDDDLALALHENVSKGFAGIADIFTHPYRANCFGGCLYRPLPLTLFAIEWGLAPKNPFVGHLMSVLWYAATAMLLFTTLRRVLHGHSRWLAAAAALLFVAHPVHTEVVANIKSRDEILCFFFVLLSIHYFTRTLPVADNGAAPANQTRNLVFAGLAYLGGLLSKESAVTAAPLFPLVAWFFFRCSAAQALRYSAWLLAPLGVFFLLRGAALTGLESPATSMMDNPIVAANGWGERLGTAFMVMGRYAQLLVFPLSLCSDYSYNAIPLTSLNHPLSAVSLLAHLALVVLALRWLPARRVESFVILAYCCGMALYSQLLTPIGTMMGERLLYFPSLWFCVGLAFLLEKWWKAGGVSTAAELTGAQKTFLGAIALIAVVYAGVTVMRNNDWKNNFALFSADVQKMPNSVRLNDGCAEELFKSLNSDKSLDDAEKERRYQASEAHSQKSLSIQPGVSAYNNLGNLYSYKKKWAESVASYEKALEQVPNYSIAKKNMASVLTAWAREEGEQRNNPEKARELLLKSVALDPKNSDAFYLIGVSYGVQGDHQRAVENFEKAWALNPGNKNIARSLSMGYRALGNTAKAEEMAKIAN